MKNDIAEFVSIVRIDTCITCTCTALVQAVDEVIKAAAIVPKM